MGDSTEDRKKAAALPEGDVVRVLLMQHAQIRDQFEEVTSARGETRKERFDELRALLAVHETAEEVVLRPVSADAAGEAVADARNAEEAEANSVLKELESMDVDDPQFQAKLEEFQKSVDEHAEKEEKEEFAAVVANCDVQQRQDLGRRLESVESLAPTHPHPSAAGSPTAVALTGPFASMVDRVRDALSS